MAAGARVRALGEPGRNPVTPGVGGDSHPSVRRVHWDTQIPLVLGEVVPVSLARIGGDFGPVGFEQLKKLFERQTEHLFKCIPPVNS